MKKTIIILSTTLIIATAGFFAWRSYSCNSSGCSENSAMAVSQATTGNGSCGHITQTASGYDAQMSVNCEKTCAMKNADASQVVMQSEAKVGDYAKCPVSGAVFLVTDESRKVTYTGKSAFTCCSTCESIFNSSPEKFSANIN